MVETARVQYVFLDIVGFTKDRHVEAQSDVVGALNRIVLSAIQSSAVPLGSTVLIPTGDGIAVALIDVPGLDVHLQLALRILDLVAQYNGQASDSARSFQVRIGVNENVDNILDDINGHRNVAGAGISMAQRIMDKADGGQLLVGATVYDILRQREKYFSTFRSYSARGKHNLSFNVYQFVAEGQSGLNIEPPSAFITRESTPAKLSRFEAYYAAHAIANRDFLASRKEDATRDYVAVVLLNFLAEDSMEAADTPAHDQVTPHTWRAPTATFGEQYEHYSGLEFWILARFSELISQGRLTSLNGCFATTGWMRSTWLVEQNGIQKLISEWPGIASEYCIAPLPAG